MDGQSRFRACFQNWIVRQESDMEELYQALKVDAEDEKKLQLIVERNIKHFQEYHEKRAVLAQHDAPSLFSPTWCTSFENSHLWIAGCRPSLSIRLVYTLCGSQLESQLDDILQGISKGNLADFSADQLRLLNHLQNGTVRNEDKLSSRMASLQEEIANHPLAVMAAHESSLVGESSGADVDRALDAQALSLASILEEADKLRLKTLKELISILTPLQAVDFLLATKKLHLSMHEWGKRRDHRHGRTTSTN